MWFSSLQSRIMIAVTGVVILAIMLILLFLGIETKKELSMAMEENAINLLNATKNQVESQYNSIQYYKTSMLHRRKLELKNNIEIAFSIISTVYNDFKEINLSEKEAKKRLLNRIRALRYSDNVGYFWINDLTRPIPKMIMHPIIPKLDGKILNDKKFNCALGKNENLFKAFVDVCLEHGDGYVDYFWPKPLPTGLTEDMPKISFVKLFKPWNWIIGTGVYVDDIEKDIKTRLDAVIKDLNETIPKQKIGDSGYFFIFDENNFMLAHPNYAGKSGNNLINPVTKKRILDELKEAYNTSTHSLEYFWDKPGHKGEFRFLKKAYVTYFEPLGWYIVSSVYQDDYEKKIKTLNKKIIIFSIFFILFSLFIAFLISKSISKPLDNLVKSIAKCDKDGIPIGIIAEERFTEISILSSTIKNMVNTIVKSRDKLKESESFNKILFKDSRIPLIVMDSDTYEYIDCNQAAVDIYGFSSIEETIGKTPLDVSAETQYGGESSSIAMKKIISDADKLGSVIFNWRHKKPTGEFWDAEVQLMVFWYMEKKLFQFSLLDITERKKAQEELAQRRKMDAIGQLAGGVAHDFNNVLAGIIGAAQLLEIKAKNLTKKDKGYIDIIISSSKRAAGLTSKLLAFGRKGKIMSTTINIHSVIKDTESILSKTIDKKIKIIVSNNAENYNVIGDNSGLQNAFLNLGINASHAMEQGGVLTFETKNVFLENFYCSASTFNLKPGEFIEIRISDTGTGISHENLQKIFDPFFTTKEAGKGTGLGLAAVYGMVQDHNGAINVYSEVGIGTVFHVYLPTTTEKTDMLQKQKPVLKGEGSILLVDDEEIIRITAKNMLEEIGYKVFLASNGLDAVDIYGKRSKEIDLVIMDMIMPEMNGSEAFFKMKEINQEVKVIISSGFTKDESLDTLRKEGLKGFIQKPFSIYELSTLLSSIEKKDVG